MTGPDAWRGHRNVRKITRDVILIAPLVAVMTIGVYLLGAIVAVGIGIIGATMTRRRR